MNTAITMKRVGIVVFLVLLVAGVLYFFGKTSSYEKFVREYVVEGYNEEQKTLPLVFTGDIMLGRYVETLMNIHGDAYPFGEVADFLRSRVTIANLEGSIPKVHIPTRPFTMVFSFSSKIPKILKENGIRAVSLANNHSLDQGSDGYENTKLVLDEVGIGHFGGYSTTLPEHFETYLKDTSVIVYGINMISGTWDKQAAYDVTKLLRDQYPQSLLIAYIHWGNEYDLKQGQEQELFAHALVDRGVDAIVGAHPHVTQGIEVYKGVPIFYSLGNFIFDQYFSKEVERGYLISLDRDGDALVYSLIPVGSKRSKVSFPTSEESNEILETVAKSSDIAIRKNIREGSIKIPLHSR